MAKVHDKYVIELAEVIKGYGNDPNVADPFRLSEFYRFYELPNIAVSRENFENMKPFVEVQTDEPSCESCRYNPLDWDEEPCDSCSPRNIHWKPHSKELSYTHKALDSTQPNDSNTLSASANTLNALDCVSRQAVRDWLLKWDGYIDMDIIARMQYRVIDIPSAQPEHNYCRECKWSRCHINADKYGNTETYWRCIYWCGETDEEGFCYNWGRRTDEYT